jgi:hypothetical protein
MNLRQRWQQTTLSNKLMVITTAIVAFGTVFYVVVAIFQWQLMKESGEQTSRQTDKVIAEARRIADTSNESARQAKVALDATINNFRLEQRAWIGVTQVYSPEYTDGDNKVYLKEGQKIKAEIILINSGKTPAKRVRPLSFILFIKPNIDPFRNNKIDKIITNTLNVHKNVQSNDVLQPGIRTHIFPPTIPEEAIVTKSTIDDIKHERYCLYIIGLITYEDVFDIKHLTKFCMVLDKDLTHWYPCDSNNEVN